MTVIFQGVVGSHAYGLARAGSDVDHLGVFVYPTDTFWQLSSPTDTITNSGPDVAEDITRHEIGKYLRLSLQCNPTLLELLWLPDNLVTTMTDEGYNLRLIRKAFLSERRVRDAYGGYAVQQAEKLRLRIEQGKQGFSADTAKRTAKHARHCFRLLRQGRHLLETGTLEVAVEDPLQYWAFDDMDPLAIVDMFAAEFHTFAGADSVLPSEPNQELVQAYLYYVRGNHLP